MVKKSPWNKISSKIVHSNPWYCVRQDQVIMPNGKRDAYNVVLKPPAVSIVAVNEKNEVHLIRLFRYTTQMWSLEIPTGGCEKKETLLMAAKRELREEAGLKAEAWTLFGRFQVANGIMAQFMHVFLATKLKGAKADGQEDEGIVKVIRIPLRTALIMINKGKITDSLTMTALALAGMRLGTLKIQGLAPTQPKIKKDRWGSSGSC